MPTAYIFTDGDDIAISDKPFQKRDEPGVVWMRLNGLFPNYGDAIATAHQLEEMFKRFNIETVFTNLNSVKS